LIDAYHQVTPLPSPLVSSKARYSTGNPCFNANEHNSEDEVYQDVAMNQCEEDADSHDTSQQPENPYENTTFRQNTEELPTWIQ